MGHEIELKLTINRDDIDRLSRHPFLQRYLAGTVTRKHLTNHYYDTPDRALYTHRAAFRVRWDGEEYIQTLKLKGQCRNGLSEREEWEWPLKSPKPDVSLIPADLLPSLAASRLNELIRVFDTNFERTLWSLQLPVGCLPHTPVPTRVEIALDQGAITANTEQGIIRDEILELELELLEGESGALHSLWEMLAEKIQLEPCNISKAQRGYRLLDHF